MTSDGVVLHHTPISSFSQQVRLALEEKGVAWTSREVDIVVAHGQLDPDYLRMNPRGVVPTLVDQGRVVTDAIQILHYIDEMFPGRPLHPDDLAARARMERLVTLVDTLPLGRATFGSLPGPARRLFALDRDERLRQLDVVRREHPELASACEAKAKGVQAWFETVGRQDLREEALVAIDAALDEVAAALAEGDAWLSGDDHGLADIAWTPVAARLVALGQRHRLEARPALARWYDTVRQRPSFAAAAVPEALDRSAALGLIGNLVLPRLALAAVGAFVLLVLLRAGVTG